MSDVNLNSLQWTEASCDIKSQIKLSLGLSLLLFFEEVAGVILHNAHKENNRAKSERSFAHLVGNFLFFNYC